MNNSQRQKYKSLSNNANERGKLWKERYKELLTEVDVSNKLTPSEIVNLYRNMTITLLSQFANPDSIANYFDEEFLERSKTL